jgi:hypothetical protein
MKNQLNVLISINLKKSFVLLKKQTGIPLSLLVEKAIREYIDKVHKEGNVLTFNVSAFKRLND